MQNHTPVIHLSNISKDFRIFTKESDKLLNLLNDKWGKFQVFHALNNISLTVARGETVGLIGTNGAGKSTLLQILCGTLEATSGSVEVNGKIGALLELGAGLNPEYTGLENIKFYCSLMGLPQAEIDQKLPSIIAFADIGDFISQPVKTYSSGMFVRLAFSVVIHTEPEILIVDEALAVGDEAFQAKCYSKINQLKHAGTTIFFVSHSAQTIISLCDRAILIDQGEVILDGAPKMVVAQYQKLVYTAAEKRQAFREQLLKSKENDLPLPDSAPNTNYQTQRKFQTPDTSAPNDYFDKSLAPQPVIYDNRGVEIIDPHIKNAAGEKVNVIRRNQQYYLCYRVAFLRDVANVSFTCMIKHANGTHLGGAVSAPKPELGITYIPANTVMNVEIEFNTYLNPAVYLTNAAVYGDLGNGNEFVARIIDILMFKIQPDDVATGRESVDFHFSFTLKEVADT
jgi:lipopolysaccharide transport system ATP-binding protein